MLWLYEGLTLLSKGDVLNFYLLSLSKHIIISFFAKLRHLELSWRLNLLDVSTSGKYLNDKPLNLWSGRMIADILDLVQKHEQWREKQCINLIPSENITSPQVRSLLSSELAHRYTARNHFYMGTHFVDEIEKNGEEIAKELFRAETADLRPLSGHVADWIFLANFTKQGDVLICVSAKDGGYPGIWQKGLPEVLGIEVEAFPFSKEKMNIKTEKTVENIIKVKPDVVIFGASLFLFPIQFLK